MYPKCWSFGLRFTREQVRHAEREREGERGAWHTASHQIKMNCIANTRKCSVIRRHRKFSSLPSLSSSSYIVIAAVFLHRTSAFRYSAQMRLPVKWQMCLCINKYTCICMCCVCRTFSVYVKHQSTFLLCARPRSYVSHHYLNGKEWNEMVTVFVGSFCVNSSRTYGRKVLNRATAHSLARIQTCQSNLQIMFGVPNRRRIHFIRV